MSMPEPLPFPYPTAVKPQTKYRYLRGFGGDGYQSEAVPGAVPEKYNTPQKTPFGLYAEQLSGTPFTKGRKVLERTWQYKILPTAAQQASAYRPVANASAYPMLLKPKHATPAQKRWAPLPLPTESRKVDWVHGMVCMAGAGEPDAKAGIRIYHYAANASMGDKSFSSSDGDMLFVPEKGDLDIVTELGRMEVRPGEICVIQRGIKFKVDIAEGDVVRGYVCETFEGGFVPPDLGPIGTNGLANPRDFLRPVAWFEDRECEWQHLHKFAGEMFEHSQRRSPFDTVGWHGNYVPFKYDLARFCAVNSVTYDHLDPSIFTVVTSQTTHREPGTASCDFVIFPPRWMVQEGTFRPPYYHRNCMSEYMGNICGAYEAKAVGFVPGAATLHSCMAGHGPDAAGFELADKLDTTKPAHLGFENLAFMFESAYIIRLTDFAVSDHPAEADYHKVWDGFRKLFHAKL
eukprot:TRINITY_DN4038_c0_g5_i1.p1 TRINITY_DN4038_c0_g5~~TRINITY_DN4038_c0_g5_i1.p1  ORF type:complete len:459 (+),score=162.77 TRINITY_DN4038_c0_g5_i1:71-1447(+)